MSKVNFSKVDQAFDEASQSLFIDSLAELSTIASMLQNPDRKIGEKEEAIILRFQNELKRIKKEDFSLFEKLNITAEEESRLLRPISEYAKEEWAQLKYLRERIDELKKQITGKSEVNEANDKIVEKEKKRHINKRHNVRDGWLPL